MTPTPHPGAPKKRRRTKKEINRWGHLEQALQHATTEMLAWLRADFSYDLQTAGMLPAQAAGYEVGNVCDPAFTMLCKLHKSAELSARRRAAAPEGAAVRSGS